MSEATVQPDILEVTLRDGSYLIDFQFTADDTARVVSALENVGFRWIEVGHGLGLNASAGASRAAAATDEEYLETTARTLTKARWGMFFIPGIGRAEDLRLAARYRMPFVRIGTNINEIERARPFIELAKELGMIVSYNAMKSYAVTPAQFGKATAETRRWGVDYACLVDSAGGMYPDDVEAYLKAAAGESDVSLGFHGHDNLSLAMANTLRAVECGAALVDSSLQGIGRSAGNAVTEVVVAVLKRRGLLPHLDLKAVLDAGQGLIQPALRRRGMDPMAVTAGYARFHSSFTEKVQAYADEHKLDVRDLIVRLCDEDLVNAPDALLKRLSLELAAERMPRAISVASLGGGPLSGTEIERLDKLLRELRPRALQAGKFSALNVVAPDEQLSDFKVSGNIHSTASHVIGSVTLSKHDQLEGVLRAAEGRVDVVLLDVDRKATAPRAPEHTAHGLLEKTQLLTYSDRRVLIEAAGDQIIRIAGERLQGVAVVIAGNHAQARSLAHLLSDRGAAVTLLAGADDEPVSPNGGANPACLDAYSADAKLRLSNTQQVVVWPKGSPWFGAAEAALLSADAFVLDARIGGLTAAGMEEAWRRGVRLIRVNIWPALAGQLYAAQESARTQGSALGWGTLAGVPVVAGGAMGRRGDVIVDSVKEPTRVIGVADGRGGVLFFDSTDDAGPWRRVAEEINRRKLSPQPGEG